MNSSGVSGGGRMLSAAGLSGSTGMGSTLGDDSLTTVALLMSRPMSVSDLTTSAGSTSSALSGTARASLASGLWLSLPALASCSASHSAKCSHALHSSLSASNLCGSMPKASSRSSSGLLLLSRDMSHTLRLGLSRRSRRLLVLGDRLAQLAQELGLPILGHVSVILDALVFAALAHVTAPRVRPWS